MKYPKPSPILMGMYCRKCDKNVLVPINFTNRYGLNGRCGHCKPPTDEELKRWWGKEWLSYK